MKKLTIFLAFLLFVGFQAAAQMQISGTVTGAEDGLSIPGVSVVVKGNATIGTTTDIDGNYSLTVPSSAEALVFSFVGMVPQEVPINGRSVIDIQMESDVLEMDEVVVIAYGTTTKESFTGTASKVDAEKLDIKSVSNITQALSGEVAGVQVINTNGQPGSSASIRIRGIGSINGSRDPLYIVDGVPLQGDINAISPSDISSMTVLKDASATAIYGSRGANGVVIITTKGGKKGEGVVEVDVKYGTNMRLYPGYDVISSPEGFVETAWSALNTRGYLLEQNGSDLSAITGIPGATSTDFANYYLFTSSNSNPGLHSGYNLWDANGDALIDPATGEFRSGVNRRYTPETWSDVLFQSAKRTETSLRFSGGDDSGTYFTSFGYLNDEGYYLNSDFERFTGRANLSNNIKSWLKSNVNMSFMRSTSNYGGGQDEDSNNGFWLVDNMPAVYPVYGRDANGDKIIDEVLGTPVFDFGDGTYGTRRFASLTNAAATSTYDVVRQINNQFSGKTGLEARFLKDFTFSSDFGMEYLNTAYDNLGNPFYGGSANQGGSIYKVKNEYLSYTITNMLRYSKAFGDHNVAAFIAQEASSYERKRVANFKSKLADPFGLELNNAVVSSPASSYTIERTLESYFGQVLYDYQNKYFLQLVIRRDGSSKFINEKWGTFGSIGGAWLISNESFMDSMKSMINSLKLKASYGIIGEQGGIDSYAGYDLYAINNLNDGLSFEFDTKGNKDLTWEESRQLQAGVEFELFKRLTGSVDYYHKTTTNLLYPKRVSPSSGYAIIQVNDGEMLNSGLEIQLRGDIYQGHDLRISAGINGAFEHNEITHMPIDNATGEEKIIDQDGIYGRTVGRSLFDIYTREYAGVDPQTGAAQWYSYYNELDDGTKEYFVDWASYMYENKDRIGTIGKEKTSVYSQATEKYIDKSPIPTVRGSFDLNASYKGFTLSAIFSYSLGGYGYDWNYADLMDDGLIGGNNWHNNIEDSLKQPGDVTDVPAITGGLTSTGINYSQANMTSDRFVTKTDYLALNNVRISYDFSKDFINRIGLKGLRIFAAGDNLWVTTKREGFYPNLSEVGASSRYQYVALTTFTAGINIKF